MTLIAESSVQRPGPVVLGAAATLLLSSLSQTIVSTALPTILSDIGGSAYLSWVVVAYLLTASIVAPIYGKLGDLFGRKAPLQIAMIVFIAGSDLGGFGRDNWDSDHCARNPRPWWGVLMVVALTVVADAIPRGSELEFKLF